MTPVTRGEVEAAVEAYGLAVLCQKYPAQPTNPVEAHDHLRSLLTRLFAERDEAVAVVREIPGAVAGVACCPDHDRSVSELVDKAYAALAKMRVTP